jgi:methionyl-tRNA synthetase
MPKRRQYITTAIDYPNAAPHMGHVLEKVLADVCARWFRLRGDEVRFQIGTDEHGIKIQRTAEKERLTPKELVDRNVPLFIDLYGRLGISYDQPFMRTSDETLHWPTVIELWKKLQAAGMLEKRTYVGLYCSGCERFLTKRDLVDGQCPIHKKAPEEVKEENWFFLMSKDAADLKKLLTKQWDKEEYRIVPSFREKETLSLIEQGLEDVSFSRPKSSLFWGVPVPGDSDQVMYVWCDALTNYISGLGYFTDHEKREWWDDAEVTHVIGKDIARFHALIWPSMLKHAEVRVPDRLLIHGFLTSEGEKMSKSLGNVVVPDDVISKYGVDALRFYLSHEIPVGNDGDFSWKRFGELYDSKLRNQLGNLLNRVLVMLKKEGGSIDVSATNRPAISDVWKNYAAWLDAFTVHEAIQGIFALVDLCNQDMQKLQPWTKQQPEKGAILSEFAEVLRHVSLLLLPFVPETAQKIAKQLGLSYVDEMLQKEFVVTAELKKWGGAKSWTKVGEPSILFPPVE